MKRIGNLYKRIISLENLYLADQKARKGKLDQPAVQAHIQNWEANLYSLHHALATRQFKTSAYTSFKVYEPKERDVYRLPYFPDRIVHHAIMNILEPIFVSVFTADTYSCIKGKGIHGAAGSIKNALRDQVGTQYCLKLDIRKFYPSINHGVLKRMLRRKFKDEDLLWLLDEIIDSADGLPIGNYLSQYLANFYLAYFDHWIKEEKRVRHYFRYADDIIIFASDKASLHALLAEIRQYFRDHLKLEIKGNYQVFPVIARGVDVIGYVFRHTHIRLRKSIKKNFARSLAKKPTLPSIASYYGWIAHCNGRHLLNKLLHETVQRTGDPGIIPEFYRRQNKGRTIAQQSNNSLGFQDRPFHEKARNGMPDTTSGTEPGEVRALQRIQGVNRHDQTGIQGRLAFYHDDHKRK